MNIGFFTGLLLEIENTKTLPSAINVVGKSGLLLKDHSHSYLPMVFSGPKNILPGPFGQSLLVESGQTNIVRGSSFEGLL